MGSPSRPGFRLRRSNSKESMNSMMSLMETKSTEEFRVCEYCKTLLHRREQAIELQTVQPIISQFYDKLREYISEGSTLRYLFYLLSLQRITKLSCIICITIYQNYMPIIGV
jgi:hypothetical protein